MHIIAAFAALGLLVVVLFPFVSGRLRAARRERAVHLGESCHWYANYDEELRYEPKRRHDIIRLTRPELLARGYRPTEDVQFVPRTFRYRVPGDWKIRLWRSDRNGAAPLWLCEWATDPVRVSIGVGERERVPGVESIPLPDASWDALPEEHLSAPAAALGSWEQVARGTVQPAAEPEDSIASDWAALDRVAELPGGVSPAPQPEAAEVDSQDDSGEPAAADEVAAVDGDAPVASDVSDRQGADEAPSGGGSRRKRRRRRN
jgi:hypothetical protein